MSITYMRDHFNWIEYKNKELLLINFDNLYGEELAKQTNLVKEFILDSEKKEVYCIARVHDTYFSNITFKDVMKAAQSLNNCIVAVAIIGARPIQSIFIKTLRNITHIKLKTFDSEEEGKDWLVELID